MEAQVNVSQGKHLRIEFLTGPLAHVLEIFVIWVCEDVKEIGITTGTATVFRRATPGSVQYAGVFNIQSGRHDFFEHDGVLPVITEIVDVVNMCPGGRQDFGKTNLSLCNDVTRLIICRVGNPVPMPAYQEFVQMGILPPHGDLENPVELSERGLAGEFDAPPDGRLDIEQRDMDAIDIHGSPLRFKQPIRACDRG